MNQPQNQPKNRPLNHNGLIVAVAALSTALLCGAQATAGDASITYLRPGHVISDLSADGSALVGNRVDDLSYEAFRWTAATNIVYLGRATSPVLGVGAGSPDISYDGTRISATILNDAATLATPGLWTNGVWQEAIPPLAPNGTIVDLSHGSAWGLSGDGEHLTGFYWESPGKAHPSSWSPITGLTPLDVQAGKNARANAASFDGSVIVGWHERFDGVWQPTIWRDGTRMTVDQSEWFTVCEQSNHDGSLVVGQSFNPATATREAAIWEWNGTDYDLQHLGTLPGTSVGVGQSGCIGISDEGQIVVGYNIFSFAPYETGNGWIWTPDTGMVEANDFLNSIGIVVHPDLYIFDISCVSADGSTLAGTALNTLTFQFQSFIVTLPVSCPSDSTCVGDLNGDSVVDTADLGLLIASFGSDETCSDINGDGVVDTADLGQLIGVFGDACNGD